MQQWILKILQQSTDYHKSISATAKKFSSARPPIVGEREEPRMMRPSTNQSNKFFNECVIPLCEVRATVTVRTMLGLRNNTDNTDLAYLPIYLSVRSVFSSYLNWLGHDIETANDGNYKVTQHLEDDEIEDQTPLLPYVSLMTFFRIWKQDFPHMKVSSPAEDTCSLCDQFAKRHKFAISSTADSSAQNSLFTKAEQLPDPEHKSDADNNRGEDQGRGEASKHFGGVPGSTRACPE